MTWQMWSVTKTYDCKVNVEITQIDLLVIGSGPSGQRGALQAAKLGKSVLVVEDGPAIGGACLNSGTVPSKALRQTILTLSRFNIRKFREDRQDPSLTLPVLKKHVAAILEDQRRVLHEQFVRNKVLFLQGKVSFHTPNTVVISLANGNKEHVKAQYILISSGSLPRNPLEVPFDGKHLVDSTALLQIDKLPKKIIVLGGGVIGVEYASFFAALNIPVLLLDKNDRLLPYIDHEVRSILEKELAALGFVFHGRKISEKITIDNGLVQVVCSDGSVYESDMLIYALGREANVSGLQLQCAGLSVNSRGYLPVDEYFRTKVSHIYAVGDVIGKPGLAATSFEQGRLAARHMFDLPVFPFPKTIPTGIYAIPELSFMGETEDTAKEKKIPYVTGHACFKELAKPLIDGLPPVGMLKLIVHALNKKILGIHIIGSRSTELIHIGQVAMHFGATVDFFSDKVFNYPTYSEAYIIAAINALQKLENK